jgi:ankyrin repeat protein
MRQISSLGSAFQIRLWWGALLLLALASAVSADEFFGDQLSVREKHASDASQEGLTTAIEGVSAFLAFMEYQAFAEGRCEGYFELETAAKNGDGKSQHMLSELYRNGYCVPQDDARALQWARAAADGGYAPAYFDVGHFLVQGIGTEKNPAAAVRWLEKATATRIEAHYLLAKIYWDGEGVTQNYQKAHEYALRGAQLGDPSAQAITAFLEAQNGFQFSDAYDAYRWALIANASGRPNVVEALSEITLALEESLTQQQITQAQAEALEWEPLKLEPAASTDPTAVDLPVLDPATTLSLSREQANARLAELGLEKDRFLFFKAIVEDNLAVTALYVRAGASPETVSPVLFDTPLLHAARNGSLLVTKYLLSAGADINRSINSGNDTPVLIALSRGHRDLAELLISIGAKLDHPSIMYSAVEFNDPAFLALLKSKGVPIDQDYVGTPLSHAVSATGDDGKRRCYEKSAAFLIANGARIEGRDMWGRSLLQNAIDTVNSVGCVKLLLQNGASQAAVKGQEPLFASVMSGNAELVRLLLEHGADPNLRFELEADQVPMILVEVAKSTVMNSGSLLQLAVVEQHAGIARLLIQYGADKDAADHLGRTPFSVAESNGDSLMVAVLKGEM